MDYKEMNAIGIVRLMLTDGVITEEIAGKYFPELKESEDERIRKGLIEACKQSLIVGGFHKDKVIAWLEKQGEHANFRNKIQIGDKVTRNEDGVLVNLSQLKRVAKPVEPMIVGQEPLYDYTNANICQKDFAEQKPADKIEPKIKVKYAGCEYDVLEVKDTAGVTFYGIEDEPNHIDYVKADNCEIISGGYGIKENGSPYPTKPAVFSEQKPAWSEEDENHVKSILSTIECCKAQFPNAQAVVEAYNADIEWLKSLRLQNRWKPSDEQMEVLLSEVTGWTKGCPKQIVLESLYQDLKKLKG